jgi:hypothetical protein
MDAVKKDKPKFSTGLKDLASFFQIGNMLSNENSPLSEIKNLVSETVEVSENVSLRGSIKPSVK